MKPNNILLLMRRAALTILMVAAAATTGLHAQDAVTWTGDVSFSTDQTVSANITLGGNVTVTVADGITATITGTITGAYNLTKKGAGTLVFVGNKAYTGSTAISAGTLQLGSGLNNTGNLGGTSGIEFPSKIPMSSSPVLAIMGVWPNSPLLFKSITGFGKVAVMPGEGKTFIVTGNWQHSGGVEVQSGTLQVGNGTAGSVTGNIAMAGRGSTNTTVCFCNSSNGFTYPGVISGGGSVNILAATTFSKAQTYTGATMISANLNLGADASITSTSGITLNGTGAQLTINNATDQTYAMPIGGAGKLAKNSSGVLTLTNASYTGQTYVNGGTLDISGTAFASSSITMSNTPAIRFSNAATLTYGGVISGNGNLVHQGPGTLILTGANTYTGYTTVSHAATLQVGNGTSGSLASANVALAQTESVLRLVASGRNTFPAAISGAGKVSVDAAKGYFSLTGANTFAGPLTIEEAAGYGVYIGNGGTTGSLKADVQLASSGVRIGFSRSDDYTYNGVISGAGLLYKEGTGTLTLTKAQAYTGNTNIGDGTLALAGEGSVEESAGVRFVSGGTQVFDMSGVSGATSSIQQLNSNFTGSKVLICKGSDSKSLYIGDYQGRNGGGTYKGIIASEGTGTGKVGKYGSGTLALEGTNTFNGTLYIYDGTVSFTKKDALGGTDATVFFSGGTLQWAAGNTADVSDKLGLNSNKESKLDLGANNVSFATALTGTNASVRKLGTGTLTLAASNTFGGTLHVDQGKVEIGNGGNLAGPVSLAEGTNLEFNGNNITFAPAIGGAGQVIVKKSAKVTGANTYTGGTRIEGNTTFTVGDGGTAGSIMGNVEALKGAGLTFKRSDDYTFSGVLSGAGNLLNDGTGNLTIAGVNTFTGIVVLPGGGSLTLASSGSIASAAGLMFWGNNGHLTVQGEQTLRYLIGLYGDAPAQTIALEGNLTLDITPDTGVFGAAKCSFPGVIGGTGSFTVSGTDTLSLSGANTYTGETHVKGNACLRLMTGGSIASSPALRLTETASLSLPETQNTLQNLYGEAGTVIDLGTGASLSIGTGTTVPDGAGKFAGTFTGTGTTVEKTGLQPFTLTGKSNTASALFKHSAGKVTLGGCKWAGGYTALASTELEVKGSASVSGALTLNNTRIYMDVTDTEAPSLLDAGGTVFPSGMNTLSVSANEGTYTLMQAAGGLNAANFTVDMPGYSASLIATDNGTKLTLMAQRTDNTAPTVEENSGVNLFGEADARAATITWGQASDDKTATANLRYYVYRSTDANIAAVADCETNGTLLNIGGTVNITSFVAEGLIPETTYWFNVVVADQAGNKANYAALQVTTPAASPITGLDETKNSGVSLYPNPFTDRLHIRGMAGGQLTIYTPSGQTVHSKALLAEDELQLNDLPQGVYIFHIEHDGQTEVIRGIKK